MKYCISIFIFLDAPPLSSTQQKSCIEINLPDVSSKDVNNPPHSLSPTNEETMSSFSGWDDVISPSLLNNNNNDKQIIPSSSSTGNCYYPSKPCDLSFTVNMTTTTTTDTKSTISTITTQQKMIPNFQPIRFNLARKLIAETSESEISIQHEPWTQNTAYQSKNLQRTRLSSSFNNLSK